MVRLYNVYFIFVAVAVFVLTHGCESPSHHPDAMSLQREAMKVYKRKPDSALSVLDKAIAIDPTYHLAYNTKAMVLQRQGAYDKAIAELHKSLRWNDDQPEVHLQIAMLQTVSLRPEKAADAYERATALFDMRIGAGQATTDDHVNRAVAILLGHDEDEGRRLVTVLTAEHPSHPVLADLRRKQRATSDAELTREFCLKALFENH